MAAGLRSARARRTASAGPAGRWRVAFVAVPATASPLAATVRRASPATVPPGTTRASPLPSSATPIRLAVAVTPVAPGPEIAPASSAPARAHPQPAARAEAPVALLIDEPGPGACPVSSLPLVATLGPYPAPLDPHPTGAIIVCAVVVVAVVRCRWILDDESAVRGMATRQQGCGGARHGDNSQLDNELPHTQIFPITAPVGKHVFALG